MFSNTKTAELLKKFAKVNVEDIQDADLRAKAAKLKGKQGGFTLLELLVVVAILAAIAGTAAIALQDTDARASAAAHVAMMDELNKGVRTFRVLNKNTLPTNFDSLVQTSATDGSTDAAVLSVAAIEDIALLDLQADAAEALNGGGINSLRYVHNNAAADPADAGDCSDIEGLINSRGNAVVAGNIFLSPAANGCGYSFSVADQDSAADGFQFTNLPKVAIWTGGYERVMGQAGQGFDGTTIATDGSALTAGVVDAPVLMAVGLGPSSNLFNANDLGGMTTVPVYRHVSESEYNRFVALFNIGTVTSATTWESSDQVTLTAIVDGAGDTKEEELGEWDGTRNTI
ncbi:prepilin-type N-terminal cleavage/methylation domain-containing protein [Motiliproteus sp.]|uniref:prepilin-type N-terminal cleavage/methylation domain-containing protein n=1 Tax=Motiliproteus sp. TaxID=1898955 RepID=UPI003BAB696B